jgi:hypothetical protein
MDSARWMGQIERLARDMYELYSLFEGAPIDDHFGCEDFELPAVPPADLWQGWGPKQAQGFPY